MSTANALLGLLEDSPRHGYELKRLHDRLFGGARELRFGQVYASLSRLLRDGLIVVEAVERDEGPDRKLYAITASGVARLEEWLMDPIDPAAYLRSERAKGRERSCDGPPSGSSSSSGSWWPS